MADDSDSAGLGLIVGILAAVVVLIVLGFGFGPRLFSGTAPTQATIEAPKVPTPAPKG